MKTKSAPERSAEKHESLPDELRTAYQAHTLAQMLRMRLEAPAWTPTVPAPFPLLYH